MHAYFPLSFVQVYVVCHSLGKATVVIGWKFMVDTAGEGEIKLVRLHGSIWTNPAPRFKYALVIFFLLPGNLLATLLKLETLGKTITGVLASGTVLINCLRVLETVFRLGLRRGLLADGFRMSCSATRGCMSFIPFVGRTMMTISL